MVLLAANNLCKSLGDKVAVAGVNLQIQAGQLVALLGPNGAGKSTVVSLLIGMVAPDSGEIRFSGTKISRSAYRRRIGVVFQGSVLDDQLSVRENLLLRASMYRNIDCDRVQAVLEQFHLSDISEQLYKTLSGGQRRRVDIARAVLHRPDLLFLDEPSTGLDLQTRQAIWSILDQLRVREHLTIVLTTHYLEEAENADFVYVLDQGKIIAADTVANLKTAYAPTRLIISTTQPETIQRKLPENWSVVTADGALSVSVPSAIACIPVLAELGSDLGDFEIRKGTIDDIFLTLTGREIR